MQRNLDQKLLFDGVQENLLLIFTDLYLAPVSIVLDASTPSNGGKWELMYYVQYVSSNLPPLDGVDASDTIDTDDNCQVR